MEMTITLGNVINVGAMLGAAAVLYGRLVAIKTKLGPLWREWCDRQPNPPHNRRAGE